ncbi:magnesium transporter CorA family protein [uncultured Treponema sp.]|uniref:magnesium transporter CorA family protein n=1 Tax=uncultured Treponema sp. TaxID=162155 RepID=UPI002597908C|nr:magnesium transporter CorA family protein [uncultured Treponema sp.]
MITYWQQENGLFVKKDRDNLNLNERVWVDARNVTSKEISILEKTYNLDHDHVVDSLDPDELPRIEQGEGYVLTIMRLPVFLPNSEVRYHTAPMGAIIFQNTIITLCWTDCEVLKDLSANRIKDLNIADFPAFITRILSRADTMFLRYLKEINRSTNSIQQELQESIENNELIQLFNLEKSLMYFTSSLKSNQLLLEKIRKTKIIKFDEEDQDWLDDVEIDNRQAMEMANTYSQTITGTMDAFASVISNNMNVAMKQLTVFSIALMLISFITSFWGMNIRLPWSKSDSWTGFIVICIGCFVIATSSFVLINFMTKIKKKIRRWKNK